MQWDVWLMDEACDAALLLRGGGDLNPRQEEETR